MRSPYSSSPFRGQRRGRAPWHGSEEEAKEAEEATEEAETEMEEEAEMEAEAETEREGTEEDAEMGMVYGHPYFFEL